MKPSLPGRAAAMFGLLVTSLMVLVKVVPIVPGHFTRYEWMALAVWAGLGVLIRASRNRGEQVVAPASEIPKVSPQTESSGL
jgi:hypothetical protein